MPQRRGRPPGKKNPPPDKAGDSAKKGTVIPFSKLPPELRKIDEQFGGGKLIRGADLQFPDTPRIPTGCFELDVEIGGGWVRGRSNQLRGAWSVGKSSLAYQAAGIFQKHCHYCSQWLDACTCGAHYPIDVALVDNEKTYEPERGARYGIDPDHLILCQPDSGEEAVDIIHALTRSGRVGLIITDSVTTMIRSEWIEKSASDNNSPGALARLMTLCANKLDNALGVRTPHPTQTVVDPTTGKKVPRMWDNLTTFLWLNQKRDAIGPFSAPAPGGHAFGHFHSISVQLVTMEHEWDGGSKQSTDGKFATYQTVQFFTEKNKTFHPKRYGSFRFDLENDQIDNAYGFFKYAKRNGLFELSGSWYDWNGHHINGEAAAIKLFTDPDNYPKLQKECLAHAQRWIESKRNRTKEHAEPKKQNATAK